MKLGDEKAKESFSEQTPTEKSDGSISILGNEDVSELSSFFDLLARFDYEDKQKEKSVLKTGPLVSPPNGSVLISDT